MVDDLSSMSGVKDDRWGYARDPGVRGLSEVERP